MTTSPSGRAGLVASAAVTAASQAAAMSLGAAIALVVLLRFGTSASTDGLFAAYGVYTIVVIVAQSFRTTVVARLAEAPSPSEALDRYLGAVSVLFLATAVPLVVLSGTIARLLIGDLGDEAVDTARTALEVLWPASGAQLVSALLGAALAVRGEFALPGASYVVGGLVTIATLLALAPVAGIDCVPIALTVGGVTTVLIMSARLASDGYRPCARRLVPDRATIARAGLMVWAAAGSVALQVTLVVTIAFAARIGSGAPTLYTYATFANALIVAVVSGSMTIVLAPRLAETWDRRAESLVPQVLDVCRAGLVFVAPVIGLAAIAGPTLGDLVLSSRDADEITWTFLALSSTLLVATAIPVPLLAMYTLSRYGELALMAVATVAIQVALCWLLVAAESLPVLALATSLNGAIGAVVLFALVFGRRTWSVGSKVVREVALVAIVAGAAFAAAALLVLAGGEAVRPAAGVAGVVLYALLVRVLLPGQWSVVERIRRCPSPGS